MIRSGLINAASILQPLLLRKLYPPYFAGRWSIARPFDQFTEPGNSCAFNGFSSGQGRWQRTLWRGNPRGPNQPYALAYQPQKNEKMTCSSGFK